MGRRERSTIDRELGISTSRKVRITARPGDGPLMRYARDYEPTPPDIFREMVEQVRLPLESTTFIDLGAGKGRVLCMAAAMPFKEVVGVELVEELAEQARANLSALPKDWVRAGDLSCLTADAGAYRPPPGPKVVYLFNPFGPPVLARALRQLEAERDGDTGPPVYVLYHEPVHAKHVEAGGWLKPLASARYYAIWTTPEAL